VEICAVIKQAYIFSKIETGLKFVPFNLTTTTVAHYFSTVFFYHCLTCNNCLAQMILDKGRVCTACKRAAMKTIKSSFRRLVLFNQTVPVYEELFQT
jgi:hypothetical protein